jgi:hypothetical protein
MNDETTNLDQTDQEIFTPAVSDEEIEAAVGTRLRYTDPGVALGCPVFPTIFWCK